MSEQNDPGDECGCGSCASGYVLTVGDFEIRLTEAEAQRFVEICENPPPPNEKLKALMRGGRELLAKMEPAHD